jgi:hypothetical protein
MASRVAPYRLAQIAGLREMTTRKRPRDFSQAAKLVIDITTGQTKNKSAGVAASKEREIGC